MLRIVLAILLLFAPLANAEEGSNARPLSEGCATIAITTTMTDIWITSHFEVALTLTAGGSGVILALYTATGKTAAQSGKYWWDHDSDGVKDQNTLDGNGDTFTRGKVVPASLYTRAEVTNAPSANGLAKLQACQRVR